MAEAPAVSLFPSSPARFLFLSIIDILIGIPSGSLCGGEREMKTPRKTNNALTGLLESVAAPADPNCTTIQ